MVSCESPVSMKENLIEKKKANERKWFLSFPEFNGGAVVLMHRRQFGTAGIGCVVIVTATLFTFSKKVF